MLKIPGSNLSKKTEKKNKKEQIIFQRVIYFVAARSMYQT